MKRLLAAGFALALLVPACAWAQIAFNGTWKLDPTSLHVEGATPAVISLKDGVFGSTVTNPPIKGVKADGKDHALTGYQRFDSLAVDVIDDHHVRETFKKDGKVVIVYHSAASPDGNTVALDMNMPRGSETLTFSKVVRRVGKADPDANAVAGAWVLDHVTSVPAEAMTETFRIKGNNLIFRTGMDGYSYNATLNNKPVPLNSHGRTIGMAAVKMADKNTLDETFTRDGKVIRTSTRIISADGQTMTVVDHYKNKAFGTRTMTAHKQQQVGD